MAAKRWFQEVSGPERVPGCTQDSARFRNQPRFRKPAFRWAIQTTTRFRKLVVTIQATTASRKPPQSGNHAIQENRVGGWG